MTHLADGALGVEVAALLAEESACKGCKDREVTSHCRAHTRTPSSDQADAQHTDTQADTQADTEHSDTPADTQHAHRSGRKQGRSVVQFTVDGVLVLRERIERRELRDSIACAGFRRT